MEIVFDAELWLWAARRNDAWVFVTLPSSDSEEIRDLAGGLAAASVHCGCGPR